MVDNVSIPVIGNGDIRSPEDAKKMLDETGCTAIMIGRGLLGNPWLIKNTVSYLSNEKYELPSELDRIDMALHHLAYLKELKNDKVAALEIRNHIAWYLKGIAGSNEVKNIIFKTTSINDIINILEKFKESL